MCSHLLGMKRLTPIRIRFLESHRARFKFVIAKLESWGHVGWDGSESFGTRVKKMISKRAPFSVAPGGWGSALSG